MLFTLFVLLDGDHVIIDRLSAIVDFHLDIRMRLCDLFTDRIRCIFPGILPVVDADNRRILIDELFDHIQHRSLKLLPNGKDSLIADAHKIILLDLLVIDHGIAHRIGHLTGLYRAKLLAHALCILLRCAVRNIVDERRDSLRDRLGRDHDDLPDWLRE